MHTLHVVSHTHWDREWFETFQRFRLKLVRLVDNLLDLLENDPDYQHFMLDGQTIALEDYLAMRPEREADLERHIRSGRIQIGPWYILPDEFLVSPEATIRNLLEGDRTTRRYGTKMPVGYLPDTFGHIGQMPQMLRSFGFETACLWRGLKDEPCELWWEAPDGSRVLLSYLRDSNSNGMGLSGKPLDSFIKELVRTGDMLAPFAQSGHLLLMNGDDFMRPQPELGRAIQAVRGKLDGKEVIHSTLPNYFLALRQTLNFDTLPVVRGELRGSQRAPLLPHVLSTRIWIKQRNHTCETLLEKWAEPFSTWAAILAENDPAAILIKSPGRVLRQTWRLLMQCHPHDSICACSIDAVHEEMHSRFDQVEQLGEVLTRQSLQTIAGEVNTISAPDAAQAALVLFNPASVSATGMVIASIEGVRHGETFDLVDDQGSSIPYELIGWETNHLAEASVPPEELPYFLNLVTDGVLQGLNVQAAEVRMEGTEAFLDISASQQGKPNIPGWEKTKQAVQALQANPDIKQYHIDLHEPTITKIFFTPAAVPGQGYCTYWVCAREHSNKQPLAISPWLRSSLPASARWDGTQIKGDELGFEPAAGLDVGQIENEYFTVGVLPDGTLELLDKRSGTVYSGLNRFMDGGERGDEYTYSPPPGNQFITPELVNVVTQRNTVWQSLELELNLKIPAGLSGDRQSRSEEFVTLPLKPRATLAQGSARLEIHTEVENSATDHRLRVHFPAPLSAESALHDGHFEIVRRPVGVTGQDESWAEQTRPEVPQRAFTAIQDEKSGLLAANRGLPEAEVLKTGPDTTEIAITLLRCCGWLSRSDLAERSGGAGPGIATPAAQMIGKWSFDYALVPFASAGFLDAYHEAYAFQAPMRLVSTTLHTGKLPARAAFLQASSPAFLFSVVKADEDADGWVARGYSISEDAETVTRQTGLPFDSAEKVTISEKTIQPLKVTEKTQSRWM